MNALILNRDFHHPEDGWYHIEPRGEHANVRGGVVQVIDDQAISAIVNKFNAAADAGQLSHGHEMLIDHEHFKLDQAQETRAYGWLQRLQARSDGIYGQIRWTNTGKSAVDGGDYRFFSTEYLPSEAAPLGSDGKFKRMRPTRLDGLTLTNEPNNRGAKPITNREQLRDASASATKKQTNNNQRTIMKSVASKLGLSADASEEAVLAEVTKIMNRASELDGKVTPLTARVTELETANKTLLEEQIAADLDAHGIKEPKLVNRMKAILPTLANRAERIEFLKDIAPKSAATGVAAAAATGKIINRESAKTPADNTAAAGATADTNPDQAVAEKIRNRAVELQGTTNRSWNDCWNQAAREQAQAK